MIRLLFLFFLALTISIHAEEFIQAWERHYDGPDNYDDRAAGMAVDHEGNVIVTGYSSVAVDVFYRKDFATVKYAKSGVALWTNRFGGTALHDDYPKAIAVDTNGNVFVTGYIASQTNYPYTYHFATVKYSSAGESLWTNFFHGPGVDHSVATALAVNGDGSVAVTGWTDGGGTYDDFATIKYSAGGVPLWTNIHIAPYYDSPTCIAMDSAGNVFVAGKENGTSTDSVYAIVAYSASGGLMWTNRYSAGQHGFDCPNALVLDRDGNVLVTGKAGSPNDFVTIKYANNGLPLWTNRYNAPMNSWDVAQAMAVDEQGNVFVTGLSRGESSMEDFLTIAYSSAGAPLWTNRYDGPGNRDDQAFGIVVGSNGVVIVTGTSAGTLGSSDIATVAYSHAGVPLWTNRYDGLSHADDQAVAVGLGPNGSFYVGGTSTRQYYDFTTLKYVMGPIPLDITASGGHAILTWTNAAFGLQSAPEAQGTFTNVPGATSPYTNIITGSRQFFRLAVE